MHDLAPLPALTQAGMFQTLPGLGRADEGVRLLRVFLAECGTRGGCVSSSCTSDCNKICAPELDRSKPHSAGLRLSDTDATGIATVITAPPDATRFHLARRPQNTYTFRIRRLGSSHEPDQNQDQEEQEQEEGRAGTPGIGWPWAPWLPTPPSAAMPCSKSMPSRTGRLPRCNASGQTQGLTVRRFDIPPGTLDSVLAAFQKDRAVQRDRAARLDARHLVSRGGRSVHAARGAAETAYRHRHRLSPDRQRTSRDSGNPGHGDHGQCYRHQRAGLVCRNSLSP